MAVETGVDKETCRIIEAASLGVIWAWCWSIGMDREAITAAFSSGHSRFTREEIQILITACEETDNLARSELAEVRTAAANAALAGVDDLIAAKSRDG